MSLFNVLIIIVVLSSLIFCWITVHQVIKYNKKYKLPESQYTKLFRIFNKEHFTYIYITFVVSHALFAFWFIFNL